MSMEIGENQLKEDQKNIQDILNICFFDPKTDLIAEDLDVLRELVLKSNFSNKNQLLTSIKVRRKEILWGVTWDNIYYNSDEHFITYFLDFFRVEYNVGFDRNKKQKVTDTDALISNFEKNKEKN